MEIDIKYIDSLNGIEFENYLYKLFKSKGFTCTLTKQSNDYGADLILKHSNEEITIVQAKFYSNKVGISAIQEIVAAKKYYSANNCIVITNNYFTENAKELATCNSVHLFDRDNLINSNFGILNSIDKPNISTQLPSSLDIDLNEPFLVEATKLIINTPNVNTGYFQRKLRIGYTRALKIINTLEYLKILNRNNGSFYVNHDVALNFLNSNKKNSIFKKVICKILRNNI
ncbi:restriction endonuclease [Clostridium perfringens]